MIPKSLQKWLRCYILKTKVSHFQVVRVHIFPEEAIYDLIQQATPHEATWIDSQAHPWFLTVGRDLVYQSQSPWFFQKSSSHRVCKDLKTWENRISNPEFLMSEV